jgi:hypothetical protein
VDFQGDIKASFRIGEILVGCDVGDGLYFFSVTVTLMVVLAAVNLSFTEGTCIVMVVLPAFTPVTSPVEVTVAMDTSADA